MTLLALALALSAGADSFRVLDDPVEALQARVDLIQQASCRIDTVYFLARNDRITLTALALLRDARRRGVPAVRLIVDANFMHIPKPVLAHLLDEGVEIRVYHPLTLRHPTWVFHRMHEKVLVADGQRYITGGRNLAESYFEMSKHLNYVDRDVYVEGPSAAEAEAHFDNLWSSEHVAALTVRVSEHERQKAAGQLDQALQSGLVKLGTGTRWSDGQKDVAVAFLYDPVRDGKSPRVGARLAEFIAGAKRSIVIESPYLVPSKSLLELLAAKVREGVSVTIVTNSLRSADGVLAQAGYLKYRRRVARAGIEVWEYEGPDSLHAKSLVIDDQLALIGSYNVDPRSENLNSEVMCVAEDPDKAAELWNSIQDHIENAWRVDEHGRAPRIAHYPGARAKFFRAWAARLILPVIEPQL